MSTSAITALTVTRRLFCFYQTVDVRLSSARRCLRRLSVLGEYRRTAGGCRLGHEAWYTAFAGAIALARRRIGPRLLAAIDIGAGAGILGFGATLVSAPPKARELGRVLSQRQREGDVRDDGGDSDQRVS